MKIRFETEKHTTKTTKHTCTSTQTSSLTRTAKQNTNILAAPIPNPHSNHTLTRSTPPKNTYTLAQTPYKPIPIGSTSIRAHTYPNIVPSICTLNFARPRRAEAVYSAITHMLPWHHDTLIQIISYHGTAIPWYL